MTKEKIVEKFSLQKLTFKQERFCQLYATEREYFGNGTQAYIEAYRVDLRGRGGYLRARVAASKLLTNGNILECIGELLEVAVLNHEAVDRTLAFWIEQKAYPAVSMDAIKEYNRLKGRIVEKRENLNKHLILGIIRQIHKAADGIIESRRDDMFVENKTL